MRDTVLASLFNLTFLKGIVYADWFTAIICHDFKKGGRDDAGNFHPLNLVLTIYKVMERILKQNIMLHLIQVNSMVGSNSSTRPYEAIHLQKLCFHIMNSSINRKKVKHKNGLSSKVEPAQHKEGEMFAVVAF